MAMPILFSPLSLRGLFLRNRLVLSPMCQYAAIDGLVQDWHQQHHARFASGGIALGFVEATGVTVVLFSARKQDDEQAEASQCEHQQDNEEDGFERHGARGYTGFVWEPALPAIGVAAKPLRWLFAAEAAPTWLRWPLKRLL